MIRVVDLLCFAIKFVLFVATGGFLFMAVYALFSDNVLALLLSVTATFGAISCFALTDRIKDWALSD